MDPYYDYGVDLPTKSGYIMEFRNSGKIIFYIILNKEVLQLNTDLLGGC